MSAASFILFPGESAWRVAVCRGGEVFFSEITIVDGAAPQQVARLVADALHQSNYTGEGTVLAIPTSWCFSATISTDGLPKSDSKAMLYRLEEKLPLAAEALIADFIHRPATAGDERALGVCAKLEQLQPIVLALEAAGVAVQSISPAILLAVQGMSGLQESPEGVLLCGEGPREIAQVNLLVFENSTPVMWAVFPASAADLKLELDLISMTQDAPHVESCDVAESIIDDLSDATSLAITVRAGNASLSAARFGEQIASGDQRPWVEFRRGTLASSDSLVLHRRSINYVLAAAVALMLVVGAVMFFRASRYERVRQSAEQKMTEAFREKFPGQPVPLSVKARFESEARAGGGNATGMPEEAGRSALKTLDEVLKNLPGDGHFEFDSLSIGETDFQIEGRLRSYEDLDVITSAIRKAGLTVALPQAKRDNDKYWSFTLRGNRQAKTS